MISELLSNCQYYEEENYDEMICRYTGFGEELYTIIKEKFPHIFSNLKFYKAIESSGICVSDEVQTLDSYAIYTNCNKSFAVQLEPESPVICIWNFDATFEIGEWSEDPYKEVLDFILTNF